MADLFGRANTAVLQRYGFMIRATFVLAIWAKMGLEFKLYYDATFRGLFVSLLFVLTSGLILAGYKTRAAFIGLGMALFIHGLVYNPMYMAAGVATAAGALFPLDRYYSVRRWLELRHLHADQPIAALELGPTLATGWRVLFVALLVFVVGGPTYNQVFHHNLRLFRSWDMYHVIGRDLVVVTFFRATPEGPAQINYMKLLRHEARFVGVHRNGKIKQDLRIVGTSELSRVITRVCSLADDPASVRLDAKITTLKRGWLQLYQGEQVCGPDATPRLKPMPVIPSDGVLDEIDDD